MPGHEVVHLAQIAQFLGEFTHLLALGTHRGNAEERQIGEQGTVLLFGLLTIVDRP